MEDTLLHVFVVVVSLLLSKDPNVFHDQEDDIMVSMQDHEHFLLEEGAKLEQGEHRVAMELPHSNQEESQSHHRVPRGEGDTSDVQQITPNVKTTVRHEDQMSLVGDQNDFLQKAFAPDDQEILDFDTDKQTLHMAKEGLTHEHVSVDQNVSQGDAAQPEKPQADRTDTQADQGLLVDQKVPTSKQKLSMIAQEKQSSNQEDTYAWYFWRTLSLISFFRFLKFLRKGTKPERKTLRCLNVSQVSDLDCKTLTSFHTQCVLVPPNHSWQTCEFVEGFVNDLLEAVRTAGSDMETEDFVGVGSLYEQWASRKSIVCDIHVPIIPPKPYSFEFELLKESRGSTIQYCCRIKMVKGSASSATCPCSNSNLDDDDTLCLIHLDKKEDHLTENNINNLLCQENSSYLAKTHVVKWFKKAIRKAWDEISHKYEFELIFRSRENPGSLKVRFRSGRVILFNLTPVVRFNDSDVHLIPHSAIFSDTHWPVCFTRYENALLQHITKTLPDDACHIHCLQILSFLHKHQTGLTGPCGLTSYHLKNALLHLLVNKPSSWDLEQMGCRVNDLLTFLQQKLKAKSLNHALVGNPLIPSEIGFPEEFRVGKPINLFSPLLTNQELYLKTNRHLLEMIRNMPVLIYEYGSMRSVL
ncbi:inositol 1,4,5-trisphosphate receptor-interacting -like protein [Labeo rohita]|uniref:Inositol 1,4,5-trisphosphate receptor-interacting protein n=2 Tax=Labeo rohita TaxID=84645 RepID=A0A498LLN0_LABRO|nr:inositol 1,4,5-trisphosphate receptor-interacting protein [Labeo rohita]KAI2668203.1 Inositol 1,4,5-trisphosphate receptor-interacting protein [Labeo rohita]RXN09140.1 inositol 1,4,5-trisphosphate receptor-interacting -like protein [Labeo rohita]